MRVFRERNPRANPRTPAAHRPPNVNLHSQKPTLSRALEHRRVPLTIVLGVGIPKPNGRVSGAMTKWVDKIMEKSKSMYITIFTEDWAVADVHGAFRKIAPVVDVFLPDKRNKNGKRFTFARFNRTVDVNEVLLSVKGLWIGNYKILANLARFDRTDGVRKEVGFVERSVYCRKQKM